MGDYVPLRPDPRLAHQCEGDRHVIKRYRKAINYVRSSCTAVVFLPDMQERG